jgi:hypothetical protein
MADFDITGHLHVSINEEVIEDWQTLLHDGDEVDVFRSAAGGAVFSFQWPVFSEQFTVN